MTTTIATTTVILMVPPERLEAISRSIDGIRDILVHESFFDSQIFAVIVGAGLSLCLFATERIFEAWGKRNRVMATIYSDLAKRLSWLSPRSIVQDAARHLYGGKERLRDGTVIDHPEKPLAEKSVIALRRQVKYWSYPASRLRWLFGRYERAIADIKANGVSEAENDVGYKRAVSLYATIKDLIYRKTGEDDYTV